MSTKTLLVLKIADLALQVILFATVIACHFSFNGLIGATGTALGWQALSFLFHLPLKEGNWRFRGGRIIWGSYLAYFSLVCVLLICTIILFFIPLLLFPVLGPLFVLGYIVLCVLECRRIKHMYTPETPDDAFDFTTRQVEGSETDNNF